MKDDSTFSCSGLSDSSWNITPVKQTITCKICVRFSNFPENIDILVKFMETFTK